VGGGGTGGHEPISKMRKNSWGIRKRDITLKGNWGEEGAGSSEKNRHIIEGLSSHAQHTDSDIQHNAQPKKNL